jgi:pyrimidine nucleoside transport protein
VSFVAFIAFANGIILWITHLAGFDDIGIEFLLGKLFMPVSWLIGVPWEDCDEVGNVIGTKTIVNEFVAFQVLGRYLENGEISVRKFF